MYVRYGNEIRFLVTDGFAHDGLANALRGVYASIHSAVQQQGVSVEDHSRLVITQERVSLLTFGGCRMVSKSRCRGKINSESPQFSRCHRD